MLTAESQLVRNIVRFDSRYAQSVAVCSQLKTLEKFASQRIVEPKLLFQNYLIAAFGQSGTVEPGVSPRSPGKSSQSLGDHLARVHQRELKQDDVASPRGVLARARVNELLKDLGLTTMACIPLSVALNQAVRRYESTVRNQDELPGFLLKSLAVAVENAEGFVLHVTETFDKWTTAVTPRKGTVLETALLLVMQCGAITSGPLLVSSGANKSNVYRAIDELEACGILREVTGRKKDQVWVAPRLVETVERAVGRGALSRGTSA